MCARVRFVLVCFAVLWSTLAISGTDGNPLDALFSRLNYLEDKMLDIEQDIRISAAKLKEHMNTEEEHQGGVPKVVNPGVNTIQDKLDELERDVNASEILVQDRLVAVEQELQSRVAVLQGRLDAMEHQMNATEDTLHDRLLRAMEHIMTEHRNHLQETLVREVLKLGKSDVPIADISNIAERNVPGTGDNYVVAERTLNPSARQSETPYRSCKDAPSDVSGRYLIQLEPDTFPFEVHCEKITFGGGWIVFQQRFNGQLNFYRNWTEYRDGFGNLAGEFWLGLDYLHQITSLRPHQLLVEVRDFAGNYRYALYDEFEIGSEQEQYVLKKLGKYEGTAGDSMYYSRGKMFSTADRNNGDYTNFGNCAVDRQGAWWYVLCTRANLNGPYKGTVNSLASMYWYFSTHDRRSIAYSRMMIREVESDEVNEM